MRGVGDPEWPVPLHGGKSTGPRTAEGLQRCRVANWTHGMCAKEVRAERRRVRDCCGMSTISSVSCRRSCRHAESISGPRLASGPLVQRNSGEMLCGLPFSARAEGLARAGAVAMRGCTARGLIGVGIGMGGADTKRPLVFCHS